MRYRMVMVLSRGISVAACTLACLCGGAVPLDGASARRTVRDIRFSAESDHTRVVLDLSGEVRYAVRSLSDPWRIVIDLAGCQASRNVHDLDVRDGVMERIRVNRMKTGVQVVFDLPREAPFSHFPLKPAAGKPHRIVVDIGKSDAGMELAGGGGGRMPPEARAPERRGIAKPVENGDFIVVIDPGHGGHAPGTVSRSGLQEKVPALKLARMLKTEIERHPGYRALLTRDRDHYVGLYPRVALARESGGDVFVSLHFDSNKDRGVRGITLYFLSIDGASDESAEAAAERENLLLEVGADSAGFNDDLKAILFDVSSANAIQRSSLLADAMASELRRDPPIPFRKTKQAHFIVLKGIAMPSILVEGGYLSNRKDAAVIAKEGYLSWLAKSLADGIVAFLDKYPQSETAVRN